MTPHDLELKLFNDIMKTIEKIEGTMNKLFSKRKELAIPREVEDGIFLTAVWALDLKDKFTKYANRRYE